MKATRKFHFQPFEIESEFDGKPHAFTRAFWCGEEREFALALVDGWIRVCEVDKLESGEWNFALDDRLSHFSTSQGVDRVFMRGAFHSALSSNDIGRLFSFPSLETGRQWIFVNTEKCGSIKNNFPHTDFKIDTPLSIVEDSIFEWYDELEKSMKDEESDLSFSLAWNINQRQQILKMTRLQNGTVAEMEDIAHLLLEFHALFVKEDVLQEAEILWANFKLGNLKEPSVFLGITDFWDGEEYEISENHSLLWEIFLRYFEPRIDMQSYENYSAAAPRKQPYLDFEAKTHDFTAHERLEVRLRLGEWLTGKIPDEQIDLLLAH